MTSRARIMTCALRIITGKLQNMQKPPHPARDRNRMESLMKMKKRKKNIAFALLFLLGLSILLYPAISDAWNQYRNARLISTYDTAVDDLPEQEYDKLWKEARKYNRQHTVNTFSEAFDANGNYVLNDTYKKVLDPDGEGLMGSIEIPCIQVKIAIYHGLSEDVLEKGAGHMEGTSLPTGGKSTHAVLAAHRGLPSARLFTDLDQMKKGDIFLLHILGKTLAYKVDQIQTVLPNETEALKIIKGEDHVTLLTCTPYGVNTHRLLIRGTRTRYIRQEITHSETVPQKLAQTDPEKLLAAGLAAFVILTGLFWLFLHRKKSYPENP